MLFNSIEFAVFLPVVFLLYWFVFNKSVRYQTLFLLFASYVFYGWWDWRFLFLISFSSAVDFFVGIALGRTSHRIHRKIYLCVSLLVNIGTLGVFKYYNFFALSLSRAFTLLGKPVSDPFLLDVVLPVGISFYTFQTLSYSIDVYRRKLKPTNDFLAFFAFVSFFPQLVAGPIERAANLLPQFYTVRRFDYGKAVDGLRQILWGLFKKMVIADRCAVYVNDVFSNYMECSGSVLLMGAVFFSFQIYCDFSGYSDIAIGTSRLFGFNLMRNFAFPYFSRDIAEFWRRWHISLSTWFRDYVYIPLGGSHGTTVMKIRNVLIIFILSGFWHGANWTFVVWGGLNALYFIPLMLMKKNKLHADIVAKGQLLPNLMDITQIGLTYLITTLTWIFFRSESVSQAFSYIGRILTNAFFTYPIILPIKTIMFILFLLIVEWLQREKQHALQINAMKIPRVLRWGIYYGLAFLIYVYGVEQQEFIYFQF